MRLNILRKETVFWHWFPGQPALHLLGQPAGKLFLSGAFVKPLKTILGISTRSNVVFEVVPSLKVSQYQKFTRKTFKINVLPINKIVRSQIVVL